MTKRFIISYSLITLFLLNSVVLFAQHENAFAQQWKIEDASHALQVMDISGFVSYRTIYYLRILK